MPRLTNNQRSSRSRVASSDVANSLSRSLSPQRFAAQDTALTDLVNALEVATPFIEDKQIRDRDKSREEAAADFQTGTLKDDGDWAYKQAATKLRAEADWFSNEPALNDALNELDLDNMTPDELASNIDNLFKSQYEGLDDPDEAAVVIPLMDKYRKAKTDEYIGRQQDIVYTNQTADLEVLFKNRYERVKNYNDAVRLEGGEEVPFDYQGFHQQIKSLNYGGKVTNEVLYSIVANQAIENGDPELLDNIPDKWKDGTPTIKHIPAYNERLLNATVRSEARQVSLVKARLKAEDDANKEVLRTSGLTLVEKLTNPSLDDTERHQLINDYSTLPGAKIESVISLYNSSRSFRDDGEKRAANYDAITVLTHGAYQGTVTPSDIFSAYAEGQLGQPGTPQALANFRQLNGDMKNAKSLEASGNKDKFTAYLKGLSGKFVPNGLLSESNGAIQALKSDAELAYKKAVFEDNLSPSAAYKAALDEFLPQLNTAQVTIGNEGTPASQALIWRNSEGSKRLSVVANMAATQGISKSIQSLVTTGVLTESEATELLLEIVEYQPTP